jgi:DNA polymerase-3 subunit gamma/tau
VAYQSLYRRYRSQKFSEIVGQGHVTSGLRTAVAEGRHGHAYLFSGPRGTGKTSTARILAKALNCPDVTDGEPCGVCESCRAIEQGTSFDLHELDAASHNKVDDIRDLISRVNLGSPGRTKVYILDEVHMLSSGAENALLKTLEEPPDHVVFVLATTEPHKVVPTIRSRTQHFEFHLLPADELAEHVRWVVADAGLDVDEEAIDYVLAQGGGSARDTLSALDLVAAAGGVPAGSDVGQALTRALGAGDAAAAIAAVQAGLTAGQEPRTIGEATIEVLRNAFLAAMGAPLHHLNDRAQEVTRDLAGQMGPATVTRALETLGQALVEMRQAPDPRVPLEVALIRLCRAPDAAPARRSTAEDPADDTAGGSPTGSTDPDLAARLSELERQVAELTARLEAQAERPPGATPPSGASAPPAEARPASTPTAGSAPSRGPKGPSEGPPADGAQPTGPAAAARNRLAGAGAAAKAPPSPRSRRPDGATPGADQRAPASASDRTDTTDTSATDNATGTATDTPSGTSATTATDTVTDTPTGTATAPDDPRTEAATGPPPDEPPATDALAPAPGDGSPADPSATPAPAGEAPTPSARPALSAALTLPAVNAAFADCLESVSQKTRVRFKGGRVLDVEGSTVVFGVPNQIHRDRCHDLKGEVEQAIGGHFGQSVSLDVVVDGDAPAPTMDRAKIESRPAAPRDDEEDVGPVEELADATEQSANGVERLTKAFPGSKVVEARPDPDDT